METVIVTGAAKGLGLALTEVFAENEWHVVAACHHPADFPVSSKKENIQIVPLDVASEESQQIFVQSLKGARIDVLINNAGIYDSGATATDEESEEIISTIPDITQVFQVNTVGARHLADLLVQNLSASEKPLVLSISSGMGTYAKLKPSPEPGLFSNTPDSIYHAKHWIYSASKTALNYAMMAFAIENPHIKSVLINPGWMRTHMGGPSATLDPHETATRVFALVRNPEKLVNGQLIDYTGRVIPL